MASRTWLGSATPAVQAEPVEQAIPFASRSMSRASPSQPGKEKCAFPGRRPGPGGGQDLVDQVVAQLGQLRGLLRPAARALRGGHGEGPDGGRVEGARADVA